MEKLRTLNHREGKTNIPSMQHDEDFYSSVLYSDLAQRIYFIRDENGEFQEWVTYKGDWYITVAIEKCRKIKEDRHLINNSLVVSYRGAIREGYNHQLDQNIKNEFDHPRNKNTIKGVLSYIENINKKQLPF